MAAVIPGWVRSTPLPGKAVLYTVPCVLKVTIRIWRGRKAEVVPYCAVVRGPVEKRAVVHVARWSTRLGSRLTSLRPVIFDLDLTSPGCVAEARAEFQGRCRLVRPCYLFNYSLSN